MANSPKQARPKSTPKPVSDKSCCGPMASKRITPTAKTGPKLCNDRTTIG